MVVGATKLAALLNRATLQHSDNHYLCPLGAVQRPAAALAAWVDRGLADPRMRHPITRRLIEEG
ncbi:MAG: hypothetical protein ACJ8CR_03755 [Roseiflexaceae bacterium]